MIAVDIETFDTDIGNYKAMMTEGKLLCVGVYNGEWSKCFRPDDPELRSVLSSTEDKIFHNAVYDLGWLICKHNFIIGGTWHDTMTRTALIDEYAELSLDKCCAKFKVKGKDAGSIEDWVQAAGQHFGIKKGKNHWREADFLWAAFPDYKAAVIKYNLQDCKATYDLYMAQEPYMHEYHNVYSLECRLLPLILLLRKRGVRVDTVALDRLTAEVKHDLADELQQLTYKYDITEDIIASPKKLGYALSLLGLKSSVITATGSASWSADALELIDHPVAPLILAIKAKTSLLNKYLEGDLYNSIMPDSTVHTQFSTNKRDDGGTITGRMASRSPNVQNISARDFKHGQKTYGTEVRNCFIADEGCVFGAFDYSAIEAVLLAHYAQGNQAEWFRDQIRNGADYHNVVMDMTGIKSRDIIKRMNYGFIYGMGLKKLMSINVTLFKQLAAEAGQSVDVYGDQLYRAYHQKFPVIKDTMAWVEQQARMQGYIDGIGGRRHHKPKPELGHKGTYQVPYYKMTNFLLQGSAAEILKKAMVRAYEAGIFGTLESAIDDEYVLHAHLAVHDEIDISIPLKGVVAAQDLRQCMIEVYKERLSVPLKVSCEVGPSWGESNKEGWEALING